MSCTKNKKYIIYNILTYYISDFQQKITQIWPKRAIFEFSHKMRKRIFFRLQRLGLVEKLPNSYEWIVEKCKKTSIFGHFGPKGQFWTVFGQNGQNGNFFKKALGTFLPRLQALTNCKVSEKVMNGFR